MYNYYNRYTSGDKAMHGIITSKYKHIIRDCNDMIMNEVITTGKDFQIPFALGRIKCYKEKINFDYKKQIRKHINWDLTRKYKKVIYNLYDETDGYFPFIYWRKTRNTKILLSYYKILFKKNHVDMMQELFKNKKIDYDIYKKTKNVRYN